MVKWNNARRRIRHRFTRDRDKRDLCSMAAVHLWDRQRADMMESCQVIYSCWGNISWAILWCLLGIIIGIILGKKVIK